MSKIIKATLDAQNQVHYQGQPTLQSNYKVLIAILDEPEEEAIYSALNPVQLEQLNSEQLISSRSSRRVHKRSVMHHSLTKLNLSNRRYQVLLGNEQRRNEVINHVEKLYSRILDR